MCGGSLLMPRPPLLLSCSLGVVVQMLLLSHYGKEAIYKIDVTAPAEAVATYQVPPS